MRKQGTLLKLLIEYFNTSEADVSVEIQQNAEQILTNLSKNMYNAVYELKDTDTNKSLKGGMSKIQKALNELKKELDKKNPNVIKMINYLNALEESIDKDVSIRKDTKQKLLNVLVYLQKNTFEVWGFSDTNIHRMATNDKIRRNQILVLYKFWFEPLIVSTQYKNFNKEFILHVISQSKIPNEFFSDAIIELESFFEEQDSKISEAHFCELFDIFKDNCRIKAFVYDKEKILGFIRIELEKIMSEQEAKTRGISDTERTDFFTEITEQLIEDATVYHLNLHFLSNNFRALIRYRLGHLLYENTGGNQYKALAFYISQKDFPGNVYIHPAAKIGAKVYISEQVVIGSNCKISQYCYIGKNVCIIPFYVEQTNLLNEDIILETGVIVDDLAKIIGRVHIGQYSYINTQQLIFNNISAKMFFNGTTEVPLTEEEYQKYLTRMENNK